MAVKGLFGGPTPQDIRQLMARENEARIVQAQKMGSAGGQPIAGNMAAASQRMRNAFNTMTGGLATAMGRGPQDPRLARAVKRDTDRQEILQILEGYKTNDGVIDEREMKQAYALLISKGYTTEARQFLVDAKSMVDMEYVKNIKGQSKLTGQGEALKSSQVLESFVDSDTKKRYRTVLHNYKDGSTKTFTLDDTGRKIDIDTLKGEKIPVGPKGLPSADRVSEHLNKQEGELTIKEKGEWNKEKFTEISKAPEYSQNMVQADRLLGLLETIKSTGQLQDSVLTLKEFFGVAPANLTEFDSKTREYVTTQLQMMGRNPTDFDLKFLLRVNPGMLKSKAGNIRLLTLLKEHNRRKYEMAKDLNSGNFTRKQWYSKILVPSEDRLSEWHEKQKKMFGKAAVPDPESAKDGPNYKVVPDGNGNFKTVIDK